MIWIQITNDSVRSIALLPKLQVLDMVSCPLVDDVGLQYLENGSPSLQVLVLPSHRFFFLISIMIILLTGKNY